MEIEMDAWITKQKGFLSLAAKKEESWMSNVQLSARRPHGVAPKNSDGPYGFANEGANIVSVDEHTSWNHAQFVIDAYAKAEGRCFWLLVTEKNET